MSHEKPELSEQLDTTKHFVALANAASYVGATIFDEFMLRTRLDYGRNDAWIYANAAKPNGVLSGLYSQLYPGMNDEETYAVAAADAYAIDVLSKLGSYYDYNSTDGHYQYEKDVFDRLSFGVAERDVKTDEFPRTSLIAESPIYRARVEQGMPREMQLFLAANAMTQLISRSDWRPTSADKLYRLPQVWELTDQETLTATQVATNGRSNVLPIIVSDARLRQRYSDIESGVSISALGGEQTFAAELRRAFMAFIASDGEGQSAQDWADLETSMSEQKLSEALPYIERKQLAVDQWITQPSSLSERIQLFIEPQEAALLAKDYLQEKLAEDDPKRDVVFGLRHSASSLKCPQSVINAAVYNDFKDIFAIIETHAPVDHQKLQSFVEAYRMPAEAADNDIMRLITEYRAVIQSGDLRWPTDGWSGAPEEDAIVTELGRRRNTAKAKIKQIKAELNAKLS